MVKINTNITNTTVNKHNEIIHGKINKWKIKTNIKTNNNNKYKGRKITNGKINNKK